MIYKYIFPSIAYLKCTPSNRQMYTQGYMYMGYMGTPVLVYALSISATIAYYYNILCKQF